MGAAHRPVENAAVTAPAESPRSSAGFFSSAKSFFLPLGPTIDPGGVAGYPIDMRVKSRSSSWRAPEFAQMRLYVGVAQYGLGAYERWLAGDGEEWLAAAQAAAMHLISNQEPDGSWLHHEAFKHTFPLVPPWRCGMAQGEAASLFVRLHKTTGEVMFADAMDMLSTRPEFATTRLRWATYASSPWNRRRALASKAAFRMLVPRNRILARRMPWTRL